MKNIITKSVALVIIMFLLNGCSILENLFGPNMQIENCSGKAILSFNSLEQFYEEYNDLYSSYTASGSDITILENFESSNNFYSLRKKSEEMDDGIIPFEPNFDEWNYSTDEVFNTFLNEDGFVIINGNLHLWDDGCVVLYGNFSCNNYSGLTQIAALDNSSPNFNDQLYTIIGDYDLGFKNICENILFDFEYIAEENLDYKSLYKENIRYEKSGSSGCGLDVFIQQTFISNDQTNQRISFKLEANAIATTSNAVGFSFYLDNVTDPNQVLITDGSLPAIANNVDWYDLSDDIDALFYPGKWVEISVDYTYLNQLQVRLVGVQDILGGESCLDTDEIVLDLNCPISMSKAPLNASQGQWKFEVQGIQGNQTINWDFGDGNTTTTSNTTSVIHDFQLPCSEANYTVSATIQTDAPLCENPVTSDNVLVTNPCVFEREKEKEKLDVDGKKARLLVKMTKTIYIFNGLATTDTKLKNRFKWRKNGIKTIESNGILIVDQGQVCVNQQINGILSPDPGNPLSSPSSTKKKLKQKKNTSANYSFSASQPYEVTFSHDNPNWTPITLYFIKPCAQVY